MLHSNHRQSRITGVSALVLAFSLAAAGCGSDQTAGGLTNPNAGSVVDRDKGGVRTDLPVPDLNADQKEPVAEAAASSPSSTGTAAGTGAATGEPGTKSEAGSKSSEVPATPPAKTNSGDASGGTKPSGPIKEGNPSSPQ